MNNMEVSSALSTASAGLPTPPKSRPGSFSSTELGNPAPAHKMAMVEAEACLGLLALSRGDAHYMPEPVSLDGLRPDLVQIVRLAQYMVETEQRRRALLREASRRRRRQDEESPETEVEEQSPAKRRRLTKGKQKATIPAPVAATSSSSSSAAAAATTCEKTRKQHQSARDAHQLAILNPVPCQGCADTHKSWELKGRRWKGKQADANLYFPCCVGKDPAITDKKNSCTRCRQLKQRCTPQTSPEVTQAMLLEHVRPEERARWMASIHP